MTHERPSEVPVEKLLLRLNEAAELVSVSETKLRGLIDRGEVVAVDMNGVMRIAMDDLIAFKDRLRRGAQVIPRRKDEAPPGALT